MPDPAPKCPIPAVAEALEPYLKDRHEVSAIRHALQARFHREVTTDDSPFSPLNLSNQSIPVDQTPSSAFTGVRRAYLKALQAHTAAQAKYEALRTELESLKSAQPQAQGPDAKDVPSIADVYLPLLRQRERQRKLRVINRAFADISAASSSLTALSPDRVLANVGDAPTPPISDSNSQFKQQDWDVESRILDLKKAILSTKRGIESASRPAKPPPSDSSPPISQEVTGLQNALNELTVWMENQLVIISAADTSAAPKPSPEHAVSDPTDTRARPAPSLADIETIYENYLDARESLIYQIHNPPVRDAEQAVLPLLPQSPNPASSIAITNPLVPSEILLPYMKNLTALKQTSETLAQHSAHARKQIAAQEAEMTRMLLRMAGESHLLGSAGSAGDMLPSMRAMEAANVPGGAQWAQAGRTAGEQTRKQVEQRLGEGRESADDAERLIEEMLKTPGEMRGLI